MKETKSEYIKREIEIKKTELHRGWEKYKKEEVISFIPFALFASLTTMGLFLGTNMLLAAGSITASVICHKYKNSKKHDNYENRLNQEIKHLNGLKEGKYIVKNARETKVSKLLEISNKQVNAEVKYDNANTITLVSKAITVIGAISTYINPITVWIPIIGVTANIFANNNEIKKHRICEKLETKANNLIHDLDVDAIIYNREDKEEKKEKVEAKGSKLNKCYMLDSMIDNETYMDEKVKTYKKQR